MLDFGPQHRLAYDVFCLIYFCVSTAIECEALPAIENGFITYAVDNVPNYDLGTTATYACNEGYFLDLSVGVRVRTCVDDDGMDALGVFTDQAPSCVRKFVSFYSLRQSVTVT